MFHASNNIKSEFVDEEDQQRLAMVDMNDDTLKALQEMKSGASSYNHNDVQRYILSKFTKKPLSRPNPIS